MAEKLRVAKTLVVGLGSSGTEVCDAIAHRIKWEYGGGQRVPWVRFLCLETDGGKVLQSVPKSDMLALTIASMEYQQVTQFSSAYDEAIDLRSWADPATLQKVPHGAVATGAGNIRMVGRLSLLFPKNYKAVHNALDGRLSALRRLKQSDATEALGKLPDGTQPEVEFANENVLRIFVVGSLCGGTGSGTAADAGYILGHLKKPDEMTIAIFSLPLPSLTIQNTPDAERLKRNAYAALTELNHFSLIGSVTKPDIRLSGGTTIKTQDSSPYDAPFLVFPADHSTEAVRRMHRGIADRIFLNAFVPEVDPFDKLANAWLSDRNGHAHAFCTFGLSALEFPKYQVIDACAKRLLLKAIREWRQLPHEESAAKGALVRAGFDLKDLKARLLKTDTGQDMVTVVADSVNTILDKASTAPDEARTLLAALRMALGTQVAPAVATGGLAPGWGMACVEAQVETVAEHVESRLRTAVGATLLPGNGLGATRDLLNKAKDTVQEWRVLKVPGTKGYEEATDSALEAVAAGKPGCLVFWKRQEAQERKEALRAALQEERDAHLEALWRSRIGGDTGVASLLASVVDDTWKRIRALDDRAGRMVDRLDSEVRRLSGTEPPSVNGQTVFDAAMNAGTVDTHYWKEIEGKKTGKETREVAEVRLAGEVIESWTALPSHVLPGAKNHWLVTHTDPAGDQFPPADYEALLGEARSCFSGLRGLSINGWFEDPGFSGWLSKVQDAMRPSVHVDDALAVEGSHAAILRRDMVLIPAGHHHEAIKEQVLDAAGSLALEFEVSPDPARILFVSEIYRFPLYGVPAIVAEHSSLAQAHCTEHTSFFTRKDVYWTGLSPEEHDRLRKAEECIVVGLLLGKLVPMRGKLRFTVRKTGPGAPTEESLPYGVRKAAHALNPLQAWGAGGGADFANKLEALEDLVSAEVTRMPPFEFVEFIDAQVEAGTGAEVPDFVAMVRTVFRRYCSRTPALYAAFKTKYPPDPAAIRLMTRVKGDPRPTGGNYDKDGLYCRREECCSWVGKDDEDAALNGWRCLSGGHNCYPK